ncbi:hypothetical protein CK203_108305 [Vitis vinifera]|uniref:Reverse transcriptase/retrotransposon-derived protein RNase H-like domain-containing protein n=1 Tax=Vitis vinifera TaxID=29760 RepID=A0A438CC40_VITVI|nr:hypothetical protein CK203_108305 [Vitis vinifera]
MQGVCELEGVVRKFRTPLEQLYSEGHIFLISAPNHTRAPKVPKKTEDAVLYFPPCFSLLCFPLLHCSFLAYFERIWQRAMELQSLEEAKPIHQPQRRLNPHLQEVVQAEVLKLLQAGIIYPYLTALGNDHFPLPFIDQVLERVSGHPFYCFLDGYSGRMPFGLCNAPATFQRCMLSIFSDMVERIVEVLMDDNTIYGGIVPGHIISEKGIEVDKAKVELIVKLPSPTTVKGVRQFLGHTGFYRSDFAIGAMLGQKEDGKPYVIYYASKTLNEAQRNYTTTEKELLAIMFALDKFRAYLMDSLIQEFDLQIKDKKGVENVVADHLSRLAIVHNSHVLPINDDFPKESLMLLGKTPWYAHIANYLVTGEVPSEWKHKIGSTSLQRSMLIIGKSLSFSSIDSLMDSYALALMQIGNLRIGSSRWGCNYGDACFPNRCCASFAQASHNLKVLCEFRTSLEQLSSEGHIFLISAPNCTRFEVLDS